MKIVSELFKMKQWFKPATPPPAEKARVKVLVIDDNDDFRQLVIDLLTPLGYDVFTAGNPVKGLEFYAREKDNIQLVLVDYYMPQLSGPQTMEWLRKLNPDVKVIMCSGADALHLRQMQVHRVMDGYLQKPFHLQDAQTVISHVLEPAIHA